MAEAEVVVEQAEVDPSTLDDAKLDELIAAPEGEDAVDKTPAEVVDKPAEVVAADAEKKPVETEEEKAARQVKDKEAFLAKQKSESERLEAEIQANATRIGELRKQAAEKRKLAGETDNPVETAEHVADARDLERRARETEDSNIVAANRKTVSSLHQEFESLIPDMATIIDEHMSSLGKTPQEKAVIVEDFKRNPYAIPAAVLSNLAEAAKGRRKATVLEAKVAKLEAENESLKKKGDNVLKMVAKAADSPSILSGKSTGATSSGKVSDVSADAISDLSTAELDALLDAASKEEAK